MTTRIDDDSELPLPPRLADGLRRLYPPGSAVPPAVEGEILARARSHFARRRRLNLILGWAAAASVAAAFLVLALCLRPLAKMKQDGSAPPSTILAREDIDHNGRIDILDAFALARRLQSAQPLGTAFDLNGDGRTSQADVDLIAMAAVRLERGSLQ